MDTLATHSLVKEQLMPEAPGPIAASLVADLYGKQVRVQLTSRARAAAASLAQPLMLQMELYFSCLVRKRVLALPLVEVEDTEAVRLGPNLWVGFRPVVTEHCRIDDLGDAAPPLKTMPVKDHGAFVPHWLQVDFRNGSWHGEFGYTR